MHKLEESRRTSAVGDRSQLDLDDLTPADQRLFDVEMEKVYVEKLRQQRQKIEAVTKQWEECRIELDHKQANLHELEKKLQFATEHIPYKKKYEDTYRELKQLEREKDRLKHDNQNLKLQLENALSDRTTILKELKSSMNDADFKWTEEVAELRQIIDNKQRLIETLKNRHAEQIKRLTDETFKEGQLIKAYREETAEQQGNLRHVNELLNKTLSERDQTIQDLTTKLDNLEKKRQSLTDQLNNREEEIAAMGEEYKRLLQKMKFHLRAVKKQLHERDKLIGQQKENISKMTETIKNTESKHSNFVENHKQQTRVLEDKINQSVFDWQEEKKKLLESNRDLKTKLDQTQQQLTQTTTEKERLTTTLRQKESTEKVWNTLVRAEHFEIDRVERLMRKF